MKQLESRKGNSIIAFIVIVPLLAMFMTYFVCAFTFNRDNNYFYNVTNSVFDRVLVEGQLTNELKDDMLKKLEKAGFNKDKIEIKTYESSVDDGSDATYVSRGSEVKIQILHRKPHYFYNINKLLSIGTVKEETFYIGSIFTGMSEKY